MPSAEWYAARRREKLQAHHDKLPPEERLVNRTDWDDDFDKNISVATARARLDTKNKFLAVAVDPTVGICETSDQALSYFTPNGPPFTIEVMRKFAEAMAICSRPLLIDGVLSARSCSHTLITLWSASKAARNPVHRDVKQAVLHYVYGPLVRKGLIHTTAKEKVTAIPEDLSAFMKVLFSPRFAITITSTREVLLLALFVCLQVDCSCRVTELLMPSMNTEDTKAYKEKHSQRAFRWSSVEIFAFPYQGAGGRVTLKARLTFHGIKDVAHKGYRVKTIPLRLLPPSHVAEDSLFWLVTLGLIDGVFADISTWNDIDRLQPGGNGLLLRIKTSFREYPVFRPTKYHAAVGDELVCKNQMTTSQILDKLHKLSRVCGLKHAMLPNVLRRSSAYLLAQTVSPEERKARMGHSENSQVYWGAYRNTTSTVDFQALRHDLDKTNVATMSSVFLNTDDPAPACVSDEGMTEILNNPELVAISEEQSELLDELLTQYGSLETAQTQSPARHDRYQALKEKHAQKLKYLEVQRYKSEYKAWWAAKEGRTEKADPETPVSVSNGVDQLLGESQEQDDQISESTVPIDPQLLEEYEAEASAAAASLTKGLDDAEDSGVEMEDSLDAVQEAGDSKKKVPTSSKKPRKFNVSDEDVPRHTLVDILPTVLYDRAEHLSWAEISAVCTTVFNHLHSPGRFYPNQEPLPGTLDCRFCGMRFRGDELRKEGPSEYHSYHCEADRRGDAEYARIRLQGNDSDAVQTCPLGNCSYKLRNTNDAKFISHVRSEKKHYSSDPEPEFNCSNHDAPLVFHSLNDLRIHAITAHSAPIKILPRGPWHALLYFCPFCQVFISRLDELEEMHIQAHVNAGDAAATITQHGVCGCARSMIWVHPGFCVFCVHDNRLSILKRFRVFSKTDSLLAHVADHVAEITDAICCPAVASTPEGIPQCTEAATFGATEMGKHLEDAHGIRQVASPSAVQKLKKASQQEGLDGVQPVGKRKPAKKIKEASEEAVAEEQGLDAGKGKPKKKRKTGDRQPLGELDANQTSKKL